MINLKLADGQVTYRVDAQNDVHDPTEAGTVRLVGFQNEENVQRVNLFVTEWRENPQLAVGKFPVFSRGERGLYVVALPVESVEESNPDREVTFTATMAVDVETWAAEYHLSPEEVLDDVRSYLTTALSDLNGMLHLKGAVK